MNAVLRIFVWLLALSVVALPVVAVVNGWVGAERWPLAKLRVHGEFKRVPAEQLQQVLLPYAHAGFFAVKLQDAQDALEKLPWVESAQVRKQWPDVLEVTLVEHKPFARWGNDRLVSEQGKLFPTPKKLADLALPELDGPDSTGRRRCAPGDDGRAWQLVAGAEQRHRSGGRP
jgi:cell division protein FtsQ